MLTSRTGTEYSGECYCDNALQNGGGPAPDGELYCNMNCNGNAAEICGKRLFLLLNFFALAHDHS